MSKYRTIITAACFAAFMCVSFVNNSDADFEIVESPLNSNTNIYGGWTYDTFTVETSEPHFTVSWFVDGVHAYTSGDGTQTTSRYCPVNTLAGSLRGIRYYIEIEARSADGLSKDTAAFYLTVYEPKTDWRQEPRTSVWCYSEISRHYYRPHQQRIFADYWAYAWNPLYVDEVGAHFAGRQHQLEYYLQVFGTGVHDFARKTYPVENLPARSHAGFKSHTLRVSIAFGTDGDPYESDATITHDLWGNALQDPNIWERIGIGTTETFIKKP